MFPEFLNLPTPLPLTFQMAIVAGWVGIILLLTEGAYRYTQLGAEGVRKILHIGVGNVILLAWWLQIPAWIGIVASLLAGGVALLSYRIPILPSINSVRRQSWGTFFYAISIGLLIALFWPLQQPQFAALGILVMVWGDGWAALVGQRFGRHPYELWGMKKSWEGSLTMAIVSYLVSGFLLFGVYGNLWQVWATAGVIAIVATTLEAFSKYGVDNLTVPLGSATLAFWLIQNLTS
ncbi:MAG: SEC59/DGK1/VTE5 family protein [Leptolyngbyaceae cyanobacterium bins.59]|nr:SEC59/DGK1/VTE5 family protein [Leptolyngbyaceae cyanobacterium bins.59]